MLHVIFYSNSMPCLCFCGTQKVNYWGTDWNMKIVLKRVNILFKKSSFVLHKMPQENRGEIKHWQNITVWYNYQINEWSTWVPILKTEEKKLIIGLQTIIHIPYLYGIRFVPKSLIINVQVLNKNINSKHKIK